MHTCNPIDTPIAKGEGLSLNMGPKTPDEKREMEKVSYASTMGSLISNLHLTRYSDANWTGDLDEHRSTSGYTFLLSDGTITWSSKKQSSTALSTTEAEFMACSASVQEAVWLRRFLQSLNVTPNPSNPVMIHCDNQVCIAYMKDPKYHERMKHIEIKHSFVRDIVAKKEVILKYISTHKMVADPFTKAIPRDVFNAHVRALGLRRVSEMH
ncbi:Retrovirus-related Pol polyprotein from transposon TNT 1-94 [Cardamine amara subsp. amara]|uniref:Retrovirus-related Pol polyprotein from transposon TNT 1-94 n=1 Tax=Cardamine amara subsp. amara TaxID=228776 RepID=A0ABD1ARB1_CARAN